LQTRLGDPALYRDQQTDVAVLKERLEQAEHELEQAFMRWEALEALRS
jgi:hypothetical protein